MTNKKLGLMIVGVVAALSLLVALFVGAVAGLYFYSVANSDAARTAKTFLQHSDKLKNEIGDVRGFGWLVTGTLKTHSGDGDAALDLKVIGARATANATVLMAYRHGRGWRVTDAVYTNAAGQSVKLIDAIDVNDIEDLPPDVRLVGAASRDELSRLLAKYVNQK